MEERRGQGRGGEESREEDRAGEGRRAEESRGVEGRGEGSRGEEKGGEKRGGEKIPLICSHVLPLPSPSCAYYARLHLCTATACSTCTEW